MTILGHGDRLSEADILAIRLSRTIHDGTLGIVGAASGLHVTAYRLAQALHAPNFSFITAIDGALFHGSAIDGTPTAGACVPRFRRSLSDMVDLIDWQYGAFDVAILGGLQVDCYGNTNTIAIGDYSAPRLRGPGPIGQGALSALATEYHIVMENHSPRSFVDSVDHVSAFGHERHGRTRKSLGLPTSGPVAIHTPLAQFSFLGAPPRASLTGVMPGVTVEDVQARTGFAVASAEKVEEIEPPSDREIEALLTARGD